jgi:predicted transposase YdaD
MRRDSIFFRLFQQFPTLLFDLLDDPPENADRYRFDSVAVKETKFEIDGVFLPPSRSKGTVYFCEVQFQPDQKLYERLWSESSRYFYQTNRFSDWQAVVIYPRRSMEQKNLHPHRSLLNGGQLHRIYLEDLGDIEALPLGLAAMVLTTKTKKAMPRVAKGLVNRVHQEVANPDNGHGQYDCCSSVHKVESPGGRQDARDSIGGNEGLSGRQGRGQRRGQRRGPEERATDFGPTAIASPTSTRPLLW